MSRWKPEITHFGCDFYVAPFILHNIMFRHVVNGRKGEYLLHTRLAKYIKPTINHHLVAFSGLVKCFVKRILAVSE